MANILLNKAYNCYIKFLNNVNYGRFSQEYCLLYDAILSLKENISDIKYVQYFENNLLCPNLYQLNISQEMVKLFAWDLNPSDIATSFVWNETIVNNLGDYNFTTNTQYGLNFLYIAIPPGVNFIIYDVLGNILHNSTLPEGGPQQEFTMIGTSRMSSGVMNVTWKKINPFSTTTYPVDFKIRLF
jgi:hypothetical protein